MLHPYNINTKKKYFAGCQLSLFRSFKLDLYIRALRSRKLRKKNSLTKGAPRPLFVRARHFATRSSDVL